MKFIGYARAAFLAFREGSVVRMEPNSFHSAHPAATGASLPGITVPDEFHGTLPRETAGGQKLKIFQNLLKNLRNIVYLP